MRIKFKKGMTPEDVADMFVRIMDDRKYLIGTVNIYVQEFDEELKTVRDEEYIEIRPTEYGQSRYDEYAADMRRSKIKAIG